MQSKQYGTRIAVFALVLLCGCSRRPLTRSDIAGSYEALWKPYGTATLDVNANGTYEERFILHSGRTVQNVGQWEIDTTNGSTELVLRDALNMNDVLPIPKPGISPWGNSHLGIHGNGKRTRIVRSTEASPDEGGVYIRK